ncbi:hypothetical protein B0T22DRAFT_477247 [Podospora appendiculata]|uniref:Uncharacterized protein n=1 Tax=Podospora appendiculata TaxID=314037 RepID=A0AAE0XJC5_9PEZI|nr:hypothetical protein B0T22DRAFT_477247 [Podospora appendiculata]
MDPVSSASLKRPPAVHGGRDLHTPITPIQAGRSLTGLPSSTAKSEESRGHGDTRDSTVGTIPIGLATSQSSSPSAISMPWGQSLAGSRSKGKQPAKEDEEESYSSDYVLPRKAYDSFAHGTTAARNSGKSSPGWTSHYSSSNYSGDELNDKPSPLNSPPARLGFDHNRESMFQDVPMTPEKRVSHWPSLRPQRQQPQDRKTGGFLRGLRKSLSPQPRAVQQERKSRFSRFVPSAVGGWWDMLPNVLEEPPRRQTNSMPDGPYVQGGQAKFDPQNVL